MQDEKRIRLAILLIFVVFTAWVMLSHYLYPPPPPQPVAEQQESAAKEEGSPAGPTEREKTAAASDEAPPAKKSPEGASRDYGPEAPKRIVTVKTPLYEAKFSTHGGRLISWKLSEYLDEQAKDPYEMVAGIFQEAPGGAVASIPGADISDKDLNFAYEGPDTLEISEDGTQHLEFTWRGEPGISWTKRFDLTGSNYDVRITHVLASLGHVDGAAHVTLHTLIEPPIPADEGVRTEGAQALLSAQGKLKKEAPKSLFEDKQPLVSDPMDGWAGVGLHYFLFAWLPESAALAKASIEAPGENALALQITFPERRLAPQQPLEEKIALFIGPKDRERVEAFGHGLMAAVDLGFFGTVAKAMLWVLVRLHQIVPDWGWAIILLTVLVRVLLFPVSVWQFKSMRAMQHIQPLIKEMREKYKGDSQRQQQEMMNLYRQYKVNPFGGCLPMLFQIPVFLGLYMALFNALELRQAPWMGTWIKDLSLKDPLYVLPVLMTATSYLSMRLSPNPSADPTQKKLMQFMPLIFLVFFLNMPAGLMLYWSVSNALSIGQQLYINRAAKAAEGVAHPTVTPEPQAVAAGPGGNSSDEESAAQRRRRRRGK